MVFLSTQGLGLLHANSRRSRSSAGFAAVAELIAASATGSDSTETLRYTS